MAIVRLRKTSGPEPVRGHGPMQPEPDTSGLQNLKSYDRPLMPPLDGENEMPPLRHTFAELYQEAVCRARAVQQFIIRSAPSTLKPRGETTPAKTEPAKAGPPSGQA